MIIIKSMMMKKETGDNPSFGRLPSQNHNSCTELFQPASFCIVFKCDTFRSLLFKTMPAPLDYSLCLQWFHVVLFVVLF